MKSLILQIAMRMLLPILLLYSLFLFFRGHNYSGGGFIGGLVASGAFTLYALAYSAEDLRKLLPLEIRNLAAVGLFLILLASLVPLFIEAPFLTGEWFAFQVPRYGEIHVGTPLLFDLGVYLTVIGASLTILTNLMEE